MQCVTISTFHEELCAQCITISVSHEMLGAHNMSAYLCSIFTLSKGHAKDTAFETSRTSDHTATRTAILFPLMAMEEVSLAMAHYKIRVTWLSSVFYFLHHELKSGWFSGILFQQGALAPANLGTCQVSHPALCSLSSLPDTRFQTFRILSLLKHFSIFSQSKQN